MAPLKMDMVGAGLDALIASHRFSDVSRITAFLMFHEPRNTSHGLS
jgi:hypothetical protein